MAVQAKWEGWKAIKLRAVHATLKEDETGRSGAKAVGDA